MLHKVQPKNKQKRRKRVGRGGKRGTYSGKGMKGQKSRSGARIRPAERDLIIRLPKRRGFRNKPLSPKPKTAAVSDLERVFSAGDEVTSAVLLAKGVVRPKKSDKRPDHIKILGDGKLTKALSVRGLEVSKAAQEKIESAGGTVE